MSSVSQQSEKLFFKLALSNVWIYITLARIYKKTINESSNLFVMIKMVTKSIE